MNFSRSALSSVLSGAAELLLRPSRARALPSLSAMRMLRESSIEHADVVALRHRVREQQHRTEETRHDERERRDAQPTQAPIGRVASSCRARVA